MTREEKLLLKDLCARLPYGVKVKIGEFSDYMLVGIDTTNDKQPLIIKHADDSFTCSINIVKPYLRPMSSMTEEEREEWADLFMKPICELEQYTDEKEAQDMAPILYGNSHSVSVDWLNKNMFDYRGLIPMGLALEAPKNMYKTE